MTTPENRARHLLDAYVRDVSGAQGMTELEVLKKLIADAIVKAVSEDRDALREKMLCDRDDPCAFQSVCSHHRALAGAILSHRHAEGKSAA
jgi:hypothetical protein